MIIQSVGNLILSLFSTIFDFSIPSFTLTNSILTFINSVIGYGIDVYKYFINPVGQAMFTLFITVKVIADVYFIAMWIVKKIPVLNIH